MLPDSNSIANSASVAEVRFSTDDTTYMTSTLEGDRNTVYEAL